MVLLFSDDDLRRLCEVEKEARRRLGDACARKLQTRLSDLEAAHSVTDLVAGRPHPLKGDRAGLCAVDLAGGVRLCFEPADPAQALGDDGSIDWTRVREIRVVYIGNYHG